MTFVDRVFSGNDAVFGLTEGRLSARQSLSTANKAVSFPNTAYSLPCYYACNGNKSYNFKRIEKEALGVVKRTLMTKKIK